MVFTRSRYRSLQDEWDRNREQRQQENEEDMCEECSEAAEDYASPSFEHTFENSSHDAYMYRPNDRCHRHRSGRPTNQDKWIPGH